MNEHDFDELIEEAEGHPTEGWDFSWLRDRFQATPLPWDFTALVAEHARAASSMLDMGTGGGEWLAALPARAPSTVATEAWPPNVPVATARLEPLGVDVVQVEAAPDNVIQREGELGGMLPFDDGSFDLIVNRHESFLAKEVARVLSSKGAFLTQQLGDGVFAEFNELLGALPPRQEAWQLGRATEQVEAAGLRVQRSDAGVQAVTFSDVGALAWYLRMIPWTVPDFSIERYRERLAELHVGRWPIALPLPAFWLGAVKDPN